MHIDTDEDINNLNKTNTNAKGNTYKDIRINKKLKY